MTVVTFIMGIFTFVANIKALAGYVQEFAAQVVLWFIQGSTSATLADIADAAAAGARAQSKEDRLAATDKWQAALKRPRITQ